MPVNRGERTYYLRQCKALQALQHHSGHVRTPRKNVKARAPACFVDL
jgi:hypothetical protein